MPTGAPRRFPTAPQRQPPTTKRLQQDGEDLNEATRRGGGPAPPLPPPSPQARTTDILCHANVLCARSPYFESSLGGEWTEAQTKTVEVVLENDQAVQYLKLLIKLCYSGTYTKDGDESLDRSTRMRLAFLGNAFEMEECVRECLASLGDEVAPTDSLTILEEVPEELRNHEVMKGVVKKVTDILGDAR